MAIWQFRRHRVGVPARMWSAEWKPPPCLRLMWREAQDPSALLTRWWQRAFA